MFPYPAVGPRAPAHGSPGGPEPRAESPARLAASRPVAARGPRSPRPRESGPPRPRTGADPDARAPGVRGPEHDPPHRAPPGRRGAPRQSGHGPPGPPGGRRGPPAPPPTRHPRGARCRGGWISSGSAASTARRQCATTTPSAPRPPPPAPTRVGWPRVCEGPGGGPPVPRRVMAHLPRRLAHCPSGGVVWPPPHSLRRRHYDGPSRRWGAIFSEPLR